MKPGQIRSVTYCFRKRLGGPAAGFTLLELVIVIAILSTLVTIAITRFLALQVDAERVAMDTMLGTLRSALGIKVAELIVKQELGGLGTLAGSNPMERLAEVPSNYLGAFSNADPSALKSGSWYFDQASKTLVYLVRNADYFSGGLDNPARARFTVSLLYRDRNGNGIYDVGEALEGVRLAAVEPYAWTR